MAGDPVVLRESTAHAVEERPLLVEHPGIGMHHEYYLRILPPDGDDKVVTLIQAKTKQIEKYDIGSTVREYRLDRAQRVCVVYLADQPITAEFES
jgi:hypothetical protein